MSRPTTTLLVFFMVLNLFSAALMSTGVASSIGIETNVQGSDEVNQTVENATNIEAGSPTGSTLFGMYNALAGTLEAMVDIVTAGPTLLNQAGVPSVITGMLAPIFFVIIGIDILSFYKGWSL